MAPGGSGLGPAWTTVTIADGSPPVGFARLDGDRASGAFAALVRFPPGWTRPAAGHYLVDEEFLVIEGELLLSAIRYVVDDYAYLPAGYLRGDSGTPRGALVIAFFTGRADWIRGVAARADRAAPADRVARPGGSLVRPVSWRAAPTRACPVAIRARLLRADGGGGTWLAEGPLAARAPRATRVELFSLPARTWAVAGPGEAIPDLEPPCLCRLRAAT